MSTGSFRTRRTREFSTRQRENSAFRRRKSWSRWTSTPILPQHRSRLRSTRRSRTAESNAGTLLCLKRWVAALHGGPQRSDIDKVQEFAKRRIVDTNEFCYDYASTTGGLVGKDGRDLWRIWASRVSRTRLTPTAL